MWSNVLSISLCVLFINISPSVCQTSNQHPVVTTDCGSFEGLSKDGAFSFRGIPYAKPPIGNLRWQAPVPVNSCWEGTFNAMSVGDSCFQPSILNRSEYFGSEDCLYLNVWTPTTDRNAGLSVMVWIHGGFNEYMNGNWPDYSPTEKLAKSSNVVYVSMNYRLHAFGFMVLDLISQSSPTGTSGNYGLMDQILALKWVQNNIEYFGGNTEKVTVFGQSSGGTNIFALLASKMAFGLFQKAWLTSASPVLRKTAAEASQDNLVFLHNTGCSDLKCLRQLSAEVITQSVPWDVFPNWSMEDTTDLPTSDEAIGALPVVDGYVLTQEPLKAWVIGDRIDVPLMIGSTAQEVDFVPPPLGDDLGTWDKYEEHVKEKLSTFGLDVAQTALKLYPKGHRSPEYQFTTMATDIRVTCPTEVLALTAVLSFNAPVYRYVVKAWPSQPIKASGFPFQASYAFHSLDIMAFFGSLLDVIRQPSQSDISFQENVQRAMLAFVKEGQPANNWHPFLQSTALLSDQITYVGTYRSRECQYWLYKGFFKYGWVN